MRNLVKNNIIIFCWVILVICGNIHAQQKDALNTKEFVLREEKVIMETGREVSAWMLCLNGYRVLISGQKEYIPIFPIYTESCFSSKRNRAIDALERACNILDCMLHGETLQVFPAPKNGNFSGFSIWVVPADLNLEHPGLLFRIDEADRPNFGFRASNTEEVAVYIKDVFEVMRLLFVTYANPSNSPAMVYPDVKILKRIWLDAQQHAEKIRNIPAEKSSQSITQEDIQEAIDMLSESQRLRLRGIARLIPARG